MRGDLTSIVAVAALLACATSLPAVRAAQEGKRYLIIHADDHVPCAGDLGGLHSEVHQNRMARPSLRSERAIHKSEVDNAL